MDRREEVMMSYLLDLLCLSLLWSSGEIRKTLLYSKITLSNHLKLSTSVGKGKEGFELMDRADESGVEGEVGAETLGLNKSGTGDVSVVKSQDYTGDSRTRSYWRT